jgi:HK97 family phage portal protein
VVHHYSHDQGVTVLAADGVWHLKLMGNGIVGMSPLAFQRNTLGIAQAAENAVTSLYRNGNKPSGTLSMDKLLTPQQREEIRTNFASLTSGNDDRLLVLEGGMKFQAISFSPEDIELLSSRQFQVQEICRWYGVPSVMVNDTSGSTVWGSGIEQIVQGFYKLTLRPILEKIEASVCANLLTSAERARMEVEFDFDALLRSDAKSRMEAYRVAINAAVMTPNEARAEENLPPLEGGDQLLVQGAMVPITQAGRDPAPVAA